MIAWQKKLEELLIMECMKDTIMMLLVLIQDWIHAINNIFEVFNLIKF